MQHLLPMGYFLTKNEMIMINIVNYKNYGSITLGSIIN